MHYGRAAFMGRSYCHAGTERTLLLPRIFYGYRSSSIPPAFLASPLHSMTGRILDYGAGAKISAISSCAPLCWLKELMQTLLKCTIREYTLADKPHGRRV